MEAAGSSVVVAVMAEVVFTATSLAEVIHANLPLKPHILPSWVYIRNSKINKGELKVKYHSW